MSPKGLSCHTFTELIIVCFPSLDISSMGVPVKCETKSKRNKSKQNEIYRNVSWVEYMQLVGYSVFTLTENKSKMKKRCENYVSLI
jgi:hypothetical protein